MGLWICRSPILVYDIPFSRVPIVAYLIWERVNTYFAFNFSEMNINLPAMLGFTRYQAYAPWPYWNLMGDSE